MVMISDKINRKGYIFIICTYFLFSIMELIAKELGRRYDPMFIVFARYFSQLLFLIFIFNFNIFKILKTNMINLQLFRGLLLLLTTCFMFTGLSNLPFAEHIAIYMIGPIITLALAIVFLKEKVTLFHHLLIVIAVLGAIIIANPNQSNFNYNVIYPLLAAFCFSIFTISTKLLNKNNNPSTTLLYTAIVGTILTIPFGIYYFKTPNLFDLLLMLSMGIFVTIGHLFFIKSLELIDASKAAPFVNLTLILAVFWGLILYNEIPSVYSIMGAILIVTSVFQHYLSMTQYPRANHQPSTT